MQLEEPTRKARVNRGDILLQTEPNHDTAAVHACCMSHTEQTLWFLLKECEHSLVLFPITFNGSQESQC